MNKLYLLLLTLFIFSCQSTKQSTELDSGIPAWVKEYPVSDSHFVGIGIADRSSHPQDYIQIAQQNALQNLSSQIKVSISSQSVFLQMDREYGYEEDYKSNIEVKANEILEGYVLAGTFSQNNEYWVYYKLDKQLYQETRLARIQEAIEESKYFLNKAIMHYTPLKDKYIYYVKALDVLEPSGISYTLIQKHFPFWVKNNMYWWLVPTKRCSRKSSFLVVVAFCPTPPLFCVLYSARGVRLI